MPYTWPVTTPNPTPNPTPNLSPNPNPNLSPHLSPNPDPGARPTFVRQDARLYNWAAQGLTHYVSYDHLFPFQTVVDIATQVLHAATTQVIITTRPAAFRRAMGFMTDITEEDLDDFIADDADGVEPDFVRCAAINPAKESTLRVS